MSTDWVSAVKLSRCECCNSGEWQVIHSLIHCFICLSNCLSVCISSPQTCSFTLHYRGFTSGFITCSESQLSVLLCSVSVSSALAARWNISPAAVRLLMKLSTPFHIRCVQTHRFTPAVDSARTHVKLSVFTLDNIMLLEWLDAKLTDIKPAH